MKFPEDVCDISNKEQGDERELQFKNYIPSDKSMREMIVEVDHVKRVSQVESMLFVFHSQFNFYF